MTIMRAGHRLWRTDDGGLVVDGHPHARRLAYAAGDQLTAADAALLAERQERAEREITEQDAAESDDSGRASEQTTDDPTGGRHEQGPAGGGEQPLAQAPTPTPPPAESTPGRGGRTAARRRS